MLKEINQGNQDNIVEFIENYRRNDTLLRRKLLSYLPYLILTNLSSLLLITVDGVVVGNLVGSDAMASVNMFGPITTTIGVFSVLISSGIATSISTIMGVNDITELAYLKKAAKVVMIVSALLVAVIQIPVAAVLINGLHLSAEMKELVWQYGIGVMISLPMGLISTVGVLEMQILGKTKILAALAAIEGVTNLVLDLLFVGVFHMGVAGAGFGTAGANVVRSILTVVYLAKTTDIYKHGNVKLRIEDLKHIVTNGISEATYSLMNAVQSYFMVMIVILAFGEQGGVINGVCLFCYSLVNVIIMSIQGAARPLAGIFSGGKDALGLRMLVRFCTFLVCVMVGTSTLIIELFPDLFFALHGVQEIPEYGILCLRIYACCFIFRGIATIFRLFLSNHNDNNYSAATTIIGYTVLPILAYLIVQFISAPYLWLAHLFTELIILTAGLIRYEYWMKKDLVEEGADVKTIYLSVQPQDAITVSRELRTYAEENGIAKRLAYRAALCMEEMVHFASVGAGQKKINTQIKIKFYPDHCVFVMLDDGENIMLDEYEDTKDLITNYGMIKKTAQDVKYQYILNMNYSVLTFA